MSVAKESETYQVVANCKYLKKYNLKKKTVFIFEFYDKLCARNMQMIFFIFLKNLGGGGGGVSTLKYSLVFLLIDASWICLCLCRNINFFVCVSKSTPSSYSCIRFSSSVASSYLNSK